MTKSLSELHSVKLPTTGEELALDNPQYFINRELSHLQFNARVLQQTLDERHPLLERLHFLLIFSGNIDEFYEIRVAGLKRQITYGREVTGSDGLHPLEILKQISTLCHELVDRQYKILNNTLLPALRKEKIRFLKRKDWSEKQAQWVHRFVRAEILPVISPIGLDPMHPFPQLVNKSLNMIVSLEGKDAFGRDSGLAIVPIPRSLPRIIPVPADISDEGDDFVFLSSMIHAHVEDLFPGMIAKGCYQFRITRNADLELGYEGMEDMANALKGELQSRRFGSAVRLEVADNCPDELATFLLKQFNLTPDELFRLAGPLNLTRLNALSEQINRPELSYLPFTPSLPDQIKRHKNLFDAIQVQDILLYHPFQSFTPVVDLLRQAAKDPNVLAIKQTLYRTGASSVLVEALVDAARNGKEVTAVVELRARFDEEENLLLANKLHEAGAVVIYGVLSHKTHAKMMLIVRREGKQLRRYVHLGTGNYHVSNARHYTDYSLLTCDADICGDTHKIFQQLTGMGKTVRIKKMLHAPFTLKRQLLHFIGNEIKAASEGKPSHIIIKINALTDATMIKALYKASKAGVKVDLIVRGICCLRPGIQGVSEHIKVRSIVGRFLEHSRVFYFENTEPQLYCSSADLMERNLDQRVETCFPIENPKLKSCVLKDLEYYLKDNSQAWMLMSDGSYALSQSVGDSPEIICAQRILLEKLLS